MIFLFALIFGNGAWGNNGLANAIGYENLATSNEVQRGFDNQNQLANEREILAAVNQNFHDSLTANQSLYNELQRDIANLALGQANMLANQNECCCSTKMLIAENAATQRYESAQQTSQIVQAVQQEGAATRAMIQQDKIEALQQKLNKVELEQQLANVVRYPNGFVYNAGQSPFCGSACGCNI